MPLTRRQFLKYMATSATGIAVASAGGIAFGGLGDPDSELLVQSPTRMPEDIVTGLDTWYASLCQQCTAGCGIIVRVMEGRAKKIEGNPDHPVNRGKLCALGQAGVQALYHPDRLRAPMRRVGGRGRGQFEEISWEEALNELVAHLKELKDSGRADTLLLITEPLGGHLSLVVGRFAQAYGAEHMAYEPLEQTALRAAVKGVFGQDLLPELDIENTQYLLSFGADLLGTWLSPVRYGRGYGVFRQGRPGRRGTLVQVEPRLSMTAANADEWVPIQPGSEGLLALSMAQVIVSEGLGDPTMIARAIRGGITPAALDAFKPERVAGTTGIPTARIQELARNFATQRPSLAIGGGPAGAHTNGLFNLSAILALNLLSGSVGVPGGLYFNPTPPLPEIPGALVSATFAEWQRLAQRLRTGQPRPVNAIMVHGANPVYGLPEASGFGEALERVPYLVCFSSFLDENTAMADLVLPTHLYLEDWGDSVPEPGPGHQTLGFQQPVVNSLFSTRSFTNLLLTVADKLGGDLKRALPWENFRQLLREEAERLFKLGRGSVRAASFESFWIGLLQRGGWWDVNLRGQTALRPIAELPRQPVLPSFAGSPEEYPFHLIPFSSLSLRGGEGAHLPWLQATQDPLTTIAWQSWLELNPETAHQMGLREGDLVTVTSPQGSLEVPVYPHPGIPKGVVAMPMGQGHAFFGQYARQRGANPSSILAPLTDSDTGALAWSATRVKVSATGRRVKLPKLEGSVPAVELEGSEILQVTRGA